MTQPEPAQPRHTVDEELRHLRIAQAGHDLALQAACRKTDEQRERADKAVAERDAAQGDRDGWRERADTYRDAWHSAKDRVTKQRTRAEQAEATLNAVRDELHALNSEVRLNPIALAGRRDAVARIRTVLDQHGQTPA